MTNLNRTLNEKPIFKNNIPVYEKYVIFSTVLFIIIVTIPYFRIIDRNFRLFLTALTLMTYIIGILGSPKMTQRDAFYIIILCILFSVVNYYGQWVSYLSLFEKIYAFILFWLPLWFSIFFIRNNREKSRKKVLLLVLILQLLITLTTISGLLEFPMASRNLASTIGTLNIYLIKNIGGYDFIYGLVLFIPSLLYIRDVNKHKLFWNLALILIFICIVMSQYSTAVIISSIILIMDIIRRIVPRKVTILLYISWIIGFLFLAIAPKSIYISVADFFNSLSLRVIGDKIPDLYSFMYLGESIGTVNSRVEKYVVSLVAFAKNPVFGNLFLPNSLVGGHAEILDTLGATGLFGFTIFTCIMSQFIGMVKKNKKLLFENYYLTTVFWYFILLGCINTLFNSPLISVNAFLVPALLSPRILDTKLKRKRLY